MREVWEGTGVGARMARTALAPAGWLWGVVARARNAGYDRGLLGVTAPALPTISVGNLTVGGTGKTPMAAWLAHEVLARGEQPAIVLRGYGGDEAAVHEALVPAARVVVDADRVRGVAAARQGGATVAILDDGFQHRRIGRSLDLVLVSADRPWPLRHLPAGPLREASTGLRRADLVVVMSKAATVAQGRGAADRAAAAGARAIVHCRLHADALRSVIGEAAAAQALTVLQGARVLAVSGVGDPLAFHAALHAAGARTDTVVHRDHHAYTAREVADLVRRAHAVDFVVCTLKDAVKLRDLWPRSGPVLWYVSQRLEPADGRDALHAALDRVCSMPHPE